MSEQKRIKLACGKNTVLKKSLSNSVDKWNIELERDYPGTIRKYLKVQQLHWWNSTLNGILNVPTFLSPVLLIPLQHGTVILISFASSTGTAIWKYVALSSFFYMFKLLLILHSFHFCVHFESYSAIRGGWESFLIIDKFRIDYVIPMKPTTLSECLH